MTKREFQENKRTGLLWSTERGEEMTHEQAKSELEAIYMSLSEEKKKAIDMAIKALEQEPKTEKVIKMRDATPEEQEAIDKYIKSISKPTGVNFGALEQEPCEDAISRQEVLDVVNNPLNIRLDEIIKQLPSVKPQEKTGHWFVDERPESDREIICSNCDQPIFKYHKMDFDYRPKYCPNCGARMVEPQERSGEE